MKHWQTIPLLMAAGVGVCPIPTWAQSECRPVGEQRIYTCVHPGRGPVIVLAAGAGQDSRTWADLVGELRGIGTVVTFDRPGLGRSPTAAGPRTPTAIARELRAVLEDLDLQDPAVLVGHSMGGVHLLRYVDLFSGSVAALVLIDTPPSTFETERLKLLTEAERQARERALAEGRARGPPIIGRERDGAASEAWTFSALPGGVPLTVIVGDEQDFGESGSEARHRNLWRELSEEWLALATDSELLIAEGSGHMVHIDRPDLVLAAVRRIIARGPRRQ